MTKERIFRMIYLASVSFICLCVLFAILGLFIPIEITNNNLKSFYEELRFYGIPIAILLTLTGTLKTTDTSGLSSTKIIVTLFVSGLSFVIMFFVLLTNMCSWTNNKIFFEKKQSNSIRIVERDYSCGAYDSGSPEIKLFKVTELTKSFIWVTQVDTNNIDKNEWKRILTEKE